MCKGITLAKPGITIRFAQKNILQNILVFSGCTEKLRGQVSKSVLMLSYNLNQDSEVFLKTSNLCSFEQC